MTGMVALYIFMLAAFTGYEVIARVPVILHTPLMSGSNFVHGIVLVGAMVALGSAGTPLEKTIGFIGVLLGGGQRRRRLRRHRAHARDVQVERRARQEGDALMPAWLSAATRDPGELSASPRSCSSSVSSA